MLSGNAVIHVGFCAGHEERPCFMDGMKPFEADVGFVDAVDAVRFELKKGFGRLDVMGFPVADVHETRNMPAMIELAVQLDGSLLLSKTSPVENAEAQIDGRGVDAVEWVVEPETVFGSQRRCPADHGVEECLEDRAVTPLHAVGDCTARHRTEPEVVESGEMQLQASFDFTQRLLAGCLGIKQQEELLPSLEGLRIVVGCMLSD